MGSEMCIRDSAYLDRWGWEVGRFLPEGLAADATMDELTTQADQIPVFLID